MVVKASLVNILGQTIATNIKFINLTPHPINLVDPATNKVFLTIPPSGKVARVKTMQKTVKTIDFDLNGYLTSVDIKKTEYGEIENLPEPQPNTIYIVSTIVLVALRDKGIKRDDIVAPDTTPNSVVRDEKGNIIGVKGFQTL